MGLARGNPPGTLYRVLEAASLGELRIRTMQRLRVPTEEQCGPGAVPPRRYGKLHRIKRMTTAQEYREHAAACLQAAKFAMRADVKAVLVSMAQHWIELAERMERFAATYADEPVLRQIDDNSTLAKPK